MTIMYFYVADPGFGQADLGECAWHAPKGPDSFVLTYIFEM